MKYLALLAALFLPLTLQADLVFTQEVTSKDSGSDMNMNVVLKIKDDNARMDMGEQISMIIDGKSGDMTSLMHGQKVVMIMKSEQLKGLVQQFATQQQAGEKTEVSAPQATGNKETIEGHATEEYTHTVDGNEITYWIAKDYPKYKELLEQMNAYSKKMAKLAPNASATNFDVSTLPGMPIRTIIKMPAGGSVTTTLKSVEEKTLDASEFIVPSDYKSMSMPAFGAPAGQ